LSHRNEIENRNRATLKVSDGQCKRDGWKRFWQPETSAKQRTKNKKNKQTAVRDKGCVEGGQTKRQTEKKTAAVTKANSTQ